MRSSSVVLLLLGLTQAVLPVGGVRTAAFPSQQKMEEDKCLAVVVNRSNTVDSLSFTQLRKIFLSERSHWPNGRRITVVMLEPGQPERKTVLKDLYHMTEQDFERYFLHRVFTGESFSAPKTLATPANVRKFLFNLPGAIGYLRAADVDDSAKVIRVDGLLPGEKGYPIRLGPS